MAINNVFKTTGIKQRERQSLSITNFNGVDYLANPLSIDKSRCVDMKNIIKRDKVNQKRYGWEEVCITNVSDIASTNGNYRITGIWQFTGNDNKNHTIAYIYYYTVELGHFYELQDKGNNTFTAKLLSAAGEPDDYEFVYETVMSFVSNNKLWILTGVRYMVLDFETTYTNGYKFLPVAESDFVYVPTVITGIQEISNDTQRQALDDYNILTDKIKVQGYIHSLDSDRYNKIAAEAEEAPDLYYYNVPKLNSDFDAWNLGSYYDSEDLDELSSQINALNTKVSDMTLEIGGKTLQAKLIYAVMKQDGFHYTSSLSTAKDLIGAFSQDIGYIYTGFEHSNGKYVYFNEKHYLVFTFDTNFAGVEGLSNDFTLTYHYNKEENGVTPIDKSTFGTLYGYRNKNRLFVSGISDDPSVDYHSSNGVGSSDTDFTYFSDLDYCYYGTKNTAIKGYSILNDGSLCVLKEDSTQEPTIYFRTATMVDATSYDGKEIEGYVEEAYPLTAGNIGEGLINTSSFRQFSQDNVFLSKNGLFAITLGETQLSNVRYARERSRFINPKLDRLDLSKAACIVYQDKYFISVNDDKGTVYVADARYVTQLVDDINTYQYEWFVLENVPAIYWFEMNNKLYFTTKDGKICVFKKDTFEDTLYDTNVLVGFTAGSTEITTSNKIANREGYECNYIRLQTGAYITCKLLDNTMVDFDSTTYIFKFKEAYTNLDYLLQDGQAVKCGGRDCTISRNNLNDYEFKVLYKNVALTGAFTRLDLIKKGDIAIKLKDDKHFYIIEEIGAENVLKLPIQTWYTPSSPLTTSFIYKKPVEAFYLTAPYSFGTTLRLKTMYRYSITNNIVEGSYYQLGVRSGGSEREINHSLVNVSGINFNTFTFNDVSFEKDSFARSLMFALKIRRLNFVQFVFYNNTNTNMSVSSLSLEYTINMGARGER